MRQGLKQKIAGVLAVVALVASLPVFSVAVARAQSGDAVRMAGTTEGSARARRAANALHQFTGYVSAMDKTSFTVEKRGKVPESRVFVKHDDMRTTGDIEKDARVTVYYREEGGQQIAHRVVAKLAKAGAGGRN